MEYPSNFETPTFPAGKRIAVSRFMAVGISVLFLLIVFMCGIIFWTSRSKSIDPFIVTMDNITGNWVVIGHSHGNAPIEYSARRALQESIVGKFAANWFTISAEESVNEALWKTCDRTKDCVGENTPAYGNNECAIYCTSGEDLFSTFIYDVIPEYQSRFANGERFVMDKASIQIDPVGEISDNGGTWRVIATVQSNLSGNLEIMAFAKVARSTISYPKTMGYYVADFNAYKIN